MWWTQREAHMSENHVSSRRADRYSHCWKTHGRCKQYVKSCSTSLGERKGESRVRC